MHARCCLLSPCLAGPDIFGDAGISFAFAMLMLKDYEVCKLLEGAMSPTDSGTHPLLL